MSSKKKMTRYIYCQEVININICVQANLEITILLPQFSEFSM